MSNFPEPALVRILVEELETAPVQMGNQQLSL